MGLWSAFQIQMGLDTWNFTINPFHYPLGTWLQSNPFHYALGAWQWQLIDNPLYNRLITSQHTCEIQWDPCDFWQWQWHSSISTCFWQWRCSSSTTDLTALHLHGISLVLIHLSSISSALQTQHVYRETIENHKQHEVHTLFNDPRQSLIKMLEVNLCVRWKKKRSSQPKRHHDQFCKHLQIHATVKQP